MEIVKIGSDRAISVLGDSVYFCKTVEASGIAGNMEHYTGVDMSNAALQIAQKNLKSCLPTTAQVNLVVDDMMHFVKVSFPIQ